MATRERRGGHLGAARAVLIALVGLFAGALAGVLAPAGPASVGASTDRSFSIDSLRTEAELRTDGSMLVTEKVTYTYVGGPFQFGIRSFERNRNEIDRFAAADPVGPLEVIRPEDSVSGDWEWKLRQPTSDATITFTLTYFVRPVVIPGRDVTELDWQFLGTDHPGVGQVDILVRFPLVVNPATPETADDDTTVLRAFAHGPTNGTIRVATSEVIASVSDVPAGQFVEIRSVVPAATFNMVGTENRLATILAEEREYQDERAREADDRRNGWLFSAVLAALGAVGAGALWLVGGREAKSTEVLGEYWREPLDDPPAVAIATLGRGSVPVGPMIAGTLTDLAQRGYLRIRAEHEQRFGPDRTVHHFEWMGKPTDDLEPFERELLEMIFRGRNDADSTELSEWAQANRSTAKGMIVSMTADVKRLYGDRGYDATGGKHFVPLVLLCAAVATVSLVVAIGLGAGVGWLGVGAAVGLFAVGAGVLRNRSQAGAEAAAKAAGLKKYLKDFSQLSEAPIGHLILWERFLVFAVAFGVSAELVRGLAARLPQVMSDPNFGLWYVGAAHHFDGFDQLGVQGAAVAQAATPNSSGSGGGFSGGGSSGGGGGGGFGAR
jgi:hypothetical protein